MYIRLSSTLPLNFALPNIQDALLYYFLKKLFHLVFSGICILLSFTLKAEFRLVPPMTNNPLVSSNCTMSAVPNLQNIQPEVYAAHNVVHIQNINL